MKSPTKVYIPFSKETNVNPFYLRCSDKIRSLVLPIQMFFEWKAYMHPFFLNSSLPNAWSIQTISFLEHMLYGLISFMNIFLPATILDFYIQSSKCLNLPCFRFLLCGPFVIHFGYTLTFYLSFLILSALLQIIDFSFASINYLMDLSITWKFWNNSQTKSAVWTELRYNLKKIRQSMWKKFLSSFCNFRIDSIVAFATCRRCYQMCLLTLEIFLRFVNDELHLTDYTSNKQKNSPKPFTTSSKYCSNRR